MQSSALRARYSASASHQPIPSSSTSPTAIMMLPSFRSDSGSSSGVWSGCGGTSPIVVSEPDITSARSPRHMRSGGLPSGARLSDKRARIREDHMKLYMHPVSMTSRPVRLFMAEKGLKADEELVDLMTGAHCQEPYASLNPNKLVPMLDDDGFKLTESSAILKYLAEKFNLPEYPKDLKQRAKVNEVMDWLNTNFYREWGYGLCYPQIFPHLKRPDEAVQKATIEWGKEQSKKW